MKNTLRLLTLLLTAGTATAIAQTGKFYSTDRELSSSLINQLYQDSKGYVWMATEYGLTSFDGMRFATYMHNEGDTTSLKNNYVRSLFEGSRHRMWVGCLDGLLRYDRASDSFQEVLLLRDGLVVHPHITCLRELRNGEVWAATSGQGLFRFDRDQLTGASVLPVMRQLSSYYLSTLWEDQEGNLWIGTESQGLARYTPSDGKVHLYRYPDIGGNNISAIIEDARGELFVGTLSQGLYRYDRKADRFLAVARREGGVPLSVQSLLSAHDGTLYIGTDGQGLQAYDPDRDETYSYPIHSAALRLDNEKIHAMLEDRDGNLWLGVFQKGIVFIPHHQTNPFQYFGSRSLHDNPIGTGCVMAILRDSRGHLWVSGDSEGVYELDSNGQCLHHYAPGNSPAAVPGTIMCLFEDSEGQLWSGSYTDGLGQIDRRTGRYKAFAPLRLEKVYSITEDHRKQLYVSTLGAGFYVYNLLTGETRHYESSKEERGDRQRNELYNDYINDILCDSKGLVWLAHYQGVSCFDPEKESFLPYLGRNNLIDDVVGYAIHEDYAGRIWVGTSDGLYRFDKKTEQLRRITTADGLPNNVICGICEDEDHRLWISTYMGVCRYDPEQGRFTNYYAGDGLQGNEFTHGASFRDQEGRIYFGGIYGVTAILPSEIKEEVLSLRVEITGFLLPAGAVNTRTLSGGEPVIRREGKERIYCLSHSDNTFTVTFSAFEFASPDQVTYQYRIRELGTQWTATAPGIDHATYNHLAPGNYTFEVRAMSHGEYSSPRVLHILISPPWYRSGWAYAAYTALALLVVSGIVSYLRSRGRHRREIMEKEHAEQIQEAKLQFFINISHEIRTPMTLIISPLEELLKEVKDKTTESTYRMMYRNAQRILRLINQLMDVRKLDKGQMFLKFRETDLVEFINDLMHTFEYLAQQKHIHFTFEHADAELKAWIDLNNFDKVLLNILSNAFKFTPEEGEITVRLTTGINPDYKGALRHYFEISVTDSGIGIDKSKIDQIFQRFYQIDNDVTHSSFGTGIGLHLSRSLVSLHHGVLLAENRTDGPGSCFIIRLPLGCDHLKSSELEEPDAGNGPALSLPFHPEAAFSRSDETEEEKQTAAGSGHPLLLIAEDEEEILAYLRMELSASYRITACRNGKEALELVLLQRPDLVLSDVMMPEMSGITLCHKIRQNVNTNHIPVILLSAKSKIEDKIEGIETGADAYMVKPFNMEILKGTIANLIANRRILKTKFSGAQLQEDKIEKLSVKSADEVLMEKVMRIINDNLSNPSLNVEMLANNVGISRTHMHRKLKELTNLSARDFIRNIRMRQAATLLREKHLSISEVAYATGFTNLSHFSSTFRECYGTTPKEYREQKEGTTEEDNPAVDPN